MLVQEREEHADVVEMLRQQYEQRGIPLPDLTVEDESDEVAEDQEEVEVAEQGAPAPYTH